MGRVIKTALLPGLLLGLFGSESPAQDRPTSEVDLVNLQLVLQRAVDRVAPSVVTIQTFGGTRKTEGQNPPDTREDRKPPPKTPLGMTGFLQGRGATTGLVLSADGWILVSKFALEMDPSTIMVNLSDGRSFTAVRKGEDISRQIALVKIEAEGLPVPEILDPVDVEVGQWAFVLGRTFGARQPSVHEGVVSATKRVFGRAIQVDASTSPINYGGAVIDIEGRVMGIAVPMDASGRKANVGLYDSGIGFASTIADIDGLLERMKKGEVLHRGYLGVAVNPAHLGPGAELNSVAEKSAGHEAGLREKSTILQVDGVDVKHGFHFQMLIGSKMAGDEVRLKFRNEGAEPQDVSLRLTAVPKADMTAKEEDKGNTPMDNDQ